MRNAFFEGDLQPGVVAELFDGSRRRITDRYGPWISWEVVRVYGVKPGYRKGTCLAQTLAYLTKRKVEVCQPLPRTSSTF